RIHACDLLERVLQHAAGVLGRLQRLGQDRRVVVAERLAVPRTVPTGLEDLLDQDLPAALGMDDLDLHTASSRLPSSKPSTVSPSSKGLMGLTNQASAPDQRASHVSWGRSRSTITFPSNGGSAPLRSMATANAPAPLVISSATTTSGRCRQARAMH